MAGPSWVRQIPKRADTILKKAFLDYPLGKQMLSAIGCILNDQYLLNPGQVLMKDALKMFTYFIL